MIHGRELCFAIFLFFTLFLSSPNFIFAQSDYVLPYPPIMPGGLQYKIRIITEQIQEFCYFGTFGQFTYNLKLSDKYLVEAKTLFEYKQYLLADRALKISDEHFAKLPRLIKMAHKEGKDTAQKKKILAAAATKHAEILQQIKKLTPEEITWSPEKDQPKIIAIHKDLDKSIAIRNKIQ